MNKRLILFLGFLMTLMPFAKAQYLQLTGAQEGHTAHRGIISTNEDGTETPQETQGTTYYRLTFKALKNTSLKPSQLRVNQGKNSYKLPLQLPNKAKSQTVKAGEFIVLYAEWPKNTAKMRALTPLKKGTAQAEVLANGRVQTVSIAAFSLIMPE